MRKGQKGRQRHAAGHPRGHSPEADISGLVELSISGLRDAWTERFDADAPPVRSRDVLLRMFAWRVQEEAFGGLDFKSERQLRQIGNALERDGSYEPQIRRDLSPGVVVIREWKGVTHKVTVTADGFQYQGTHYRSLSDIARTITGTRWSGPRFFGLEQKNARPARAAGSRPDRWCRSWG